MSSICSVAGQLGRGGRGRRRGRRCRRPEIDARVRRQVERGGRSAGIDGQCRDPFALEAELDLSSRPRIGIQDDDFRGSRHARRSRVQYKPTEGSPPGVLRLPRDRSRDPARHRRATRASRQPAPSRRSIGRSPASTVAITDFHLSGDHAQITQIGDHYVFRDLRSTNGSAIERDGKRIPIDATARWEIALADGDFLLLGNRNDPVRIAVRIGDEADDDLGDRLIASRSIMDLPQVTDQIEGREPACTMKADSRLLTVTLRKAAEGMVMIERHQRLRYP